jgi:hypothetical protein
MKTTTGFSLLLFLFTALQSFSQTWQDVGGGTNNSSHGMLTWDNKLVDLGSFNNPCNRVALWDGTSWECLGGGVGIVARAGTVWNGNLVVVGDFWNVQQPCTNCNGIAMWDGTQWSNIGAGFNNDVLCVTVWNGDLVAAGDFTQSNGQPCSRIARWTGTEWQQIGPDNAFNNDIRAITEFEDELWVGGDFSNVGGCTACDGLVKWNGSAWVGGNSGVDLSGGVDTTVRVLYTSPTDGKLYMGGHFRGLTPNGVWNPDLNGVAVYDGSDWFALGQGVGDSDEDYVRAISEYNGSIVVGGYYTTASGLSANKIARFNLTTETWSAMGQGFDGVGVDEYVKASAVWNGIFFAGGAYTQAEGGPMNYIAQWYEPPITEPLAVINNEQTTMCSGGCFNFTDNSTYSPTSWNWSFPGGSITSSTAQNPPPICYSTPGTYTVTLQACNSFGCDTDTKTITVTSGPTLSVNNPTICSGSSVLLTANPSVTGGTFLWSPGGQTTSAITVSPTANTTYSVTYTSPTCGSASATATVTVTTAPTVTVTNPTICSGGTATITATPSVVGGEYEWSPGGQTTQTITVNPTVTETYTVIYSVGDCSSLPATSTVTVSPAPTVTVNSTTICQGNSTTLTATPSIIGGTYLWSPGGQTTQTITISPSTNTTYSVSYLLSGCSTAIGNGTVTVNPQPVVTVMNQAICSGNSATLTATPSIPGGTYLWSPGGQTTSSIAVNPTATTSYSVTYTLNGCSHTTTGLVTVNPIPTITVEDFTLCSGNTVSIVATPSVAGGSYLWSPGGQTSQSITVSPGASTSYSVVYTLNGCPSVSETSFVTVNPQPVVTVMNQAICSGNSALLTATPSIAGGTYLWSPGGQTTSSITVNPTETTSYSVTYTLNGCSHTTTGVVTVNPIPTVSVDDFAICSGGSATLIATPSISGGTYLWSPGGETTTSITVNPSTTTTYSVIYTLNACSSQSETSVVTVNPQPVVTIISTTICAGETATLEAIPSISGGSYLWSPGNETTAIIIVSPTISTSYSVTYTLNGCSHTTSGMVNVTAAPSVTVNDATLCSGATTVLTAVPSVAGGSFLWSPGGEITSSINVSPSSNTTYSVIYTLNGCASLPALSLVTVTSQPTVTSNSASICEGESALLTALPSEVGGTYLWSPGGANTASINVSPSTDQIYTVVYAITGCSNATSSSTVTVNPLPDVSTELSATFISAIETGSNYQWIDCNDSFNEISGENSQTFSPTQDGLYAVIITSNGCSDTSECVVFETGDIAENSSTLFTLYPNPSNDFLLIKSEMNLLGETICFYNQIGQLILSEVVDKSEVTLDVKHFAPGIYYVNYLSEPESKQKWIKY